MLMLTYFFSLFEILSIPGTFLGSKELISWSNSTLGMGLKDWELCSWSSFSKIA